MMPHATPAELLAEARRFRSRDDYPDNYRWDLLIADLADAVQALLINKLAEAAQAFLEGRVEWGVAPVGVTSDSGVTPMGSAHKAFYRADNGDEVVVKRLVGLWIEATEDDREHRFEETWGVR